MTRKRPWVSRWRHISGFKTVGFDTARQFTGCDDCQIFFVITNTLHFTQICSNFSPPQCMHVTERRMGVNFASPSLPSTTCLLPSALNFDDQSTRYAHFVLQSFVANFHLQPQVIPDTSRRSCSWRDTVYCCCGTHPLRRTWHDLTSKIEARINSDSRVGEAVIPFGSRWRGEDSRTHG